MSKKYVDSDGLAHVWEKIKEYVQNAVKVTGVKGSAESSYRTGDVELTAANVGAPGMERWVLSSGGDSGSFTFEVNSRVVLYTIGPGAGRGAHIISVGSAIGRTTAGGSSTNITFSASGRVLTITNDNTAYAVDLCFLIFRGGVTKNE